MTVPRRSLVIVPRRSLVSNIKIAANWFLFYSLFFHWLVHCVFSTHFSSILLFICFTSIYFLQASQNLWDNQRSLYYIMEIVILVLHYCQFLQNFRRQQSCTCIRICNDDYWKLVYSCNISLRISNYETSEDTGHLYWKVTTRLN